LKPARPASGNKYALVSQDSVKVEIFRRRGDIGWDIVTYEPGDAVEFAGIELTMPIGDIYFEAGLSTWSNTPAGQRVSCRGWGAFRGARRTLCPRRCQAGMPSFDLTTEIKTIKLVRRLV
jgi:hypothetical protein